MATCDPAVKGIQENSAKQAFDTAKYAYEQAKADNLACQGPTAQGAAALQDAHGDITQIQQDVDVLKKIQGVILKQLDREVKSEGILTSMSDIATDETTKAHREIEELRSEIRKERRLFLDADPSAPTSVAGLYYTREPDNQLLIAFLICFGLFLLFLGLLVLFRGIPIPYLLNLDMGLGPQGTPVGTTSYSERLTLVGGFWLVSIVMTYFCFFTFT